MHNKYLGTFLITALSLFFAKSAAAVCPICTLAVGAGVGLSRYLGVDDAVIGIWVGALTASMSMWTINWLDGKKWQFPWYKEATTAIYYALVVLPLPFMGLFGHPLVAFESLGIDKLLLGVICGSLVFWLAASAYDAYKKHYGKALFPFQKVAMPVSSLVLLSLVFYFLTNN
ncbi:hypothetical protein COT94_00445 [Candidatus Falkowbacteria bacterium CG10_big_fil_rev_8_21_14_0_10_37_14]|uniref:Uncharacterized protein n=1 Tax=Candidatus Falkowbacteria bacterium CG10_big_fil_rev_8_21_14_0_10_37_14 TaxID=1974561 RepID=A0A2M6WUF0_9BACT|nr:hypothetical protein [Candidatus Falkowbacteria bacterium]PIT96417.1 MAG: hypothetical protein COT94_00445 [Candidatus Falkowbacteria bacterium CG10_big_fil_rev_8_21_14_0_10_37_14]